MGRPATSTMHLGISAVSGPSLLPRPAATMIAFIGVFIAPGTLGGFQTSSCSLRAAKPRSARNVVGSMWSLLTPAELAGDRQQRADRVGGVHREVGVEEEIDAIGYGHEEKIARIVDDEAPHRLRRG